MSCAEKAMQYKSEAAYLLTSIKTNGVALFDVQKYIYKPFSGLEKETGRVNEHWLAVGSGWDSSMTVRAGQKTGRNSPTF